MKIFIFGQIGTGKTALINELKKKLPGYQVLCVDDFRKKYGDGTWSKDSLVKLKFVESIDLKAKDQIIEANGGGKVGEMLKVIIPKINDEVLIIVLKVSYQVRIQRLRNRKQRVNLPFLPQGPETIVRNSNSLDHWRKFGLYRENIRCFEVDNTIYKSSNNLLNMLYKESIN